MFRAPAVAACTTLLRQHARFKNRVNVGSPTTSTESRSTKCMTALELPYNQQLMNDAYLRWISLACKLVRLELLMERPVRHMVCRAFLLSIYIKDRQYQPDDCFGEGTNVQSNSMLALAKSSAALCSGTIAPEYESEGTKHQSNVFNVSHIDTSIDSVVNKVRNQASPT